LPCPWAQGKQGKEKQFFFAKKNQKTLMNRGLGFVAVGNERPRSALARKQTNRLSKYCYDLVHNIRLHIRYD